MELPKLESKNQEKPRLNKEQAVNILFRQIEELQRQVKSVQGRNFAKKEKLLLQAESLMTLAENIHSGVIPEAELPLFELTGIRESVVDLSPYGADHWEPLDLDGKMIFSGIRTDNLHAYLINELGQEAVELGPGVKDLKKSLPIGDGAYFCFSTDKGDVILNKNGTMVSDFHPLIYDNLTSGAYIVEGERVDHQMVFYLIGVESPPPPWEVGSFDEFIGLETIGGKTYGVGRDYQDFYDISGNIESSTATDCLFDNEKGVLVTGQNIQIFDVQGAMYYTVVVDGKQVLFNQFGLEVLNFKAKVEIYEIKTIAGKIYIVTSAGLFQVGADENPLPTDFCDTVVKILEFNGQPCLLGRLPNYQYNLFSLSGLPMLGTRIDHPKDIQVIGSKIVLTLYNDIVDKNKQIIYHDYFLDQNGQTLAQSDKIPGQKKVYPLGSSFIFSAKQPDGRFYLFDAQGQPVKSHGEKVVVDKIFKITEKNGIPYILAEKGNKYILKVLDLE